MGRQIKLLFTVNQTNLPTEMKVQTNKSEAKID